MPADDARSVRSANQTARGALDGLSLPVSQLSHPTNAEENEDALIVVCTRLAVILELMRSVPAAAQIDAHELPRRCTRAMARVPDGMIILHSVSGLKRWEDAGLRQDPGFYYFTGLGNVRRAILVLDGTSKESWLFVARGTNKYTPELTGMDAVAVEPGTDAQNTLGIDHVVAWDVFFSFVDARRAAHPALVLYADRGGQTGDQMGGPEQSRGPHFDRESVSPLVGALCASVGPRSISRTHFRSLMQSGPRRAPAKSR